MAPSHFFGGASLPNLAWHCAARRLVARLHLTRLPRRAVVAVGDRKARLRLVAIEPLAAGLQLVDRDRLDQMALASHEAVDLLERFADAPAQLLDRHVVADVAVRGGLPRSHHAVVALAHRGDRRVELGEVRMRRGEPLVVFGPQPEGEY